MLAGITFDIHEGSKVHQRTTDEDGRIEICFDQATTVSIEELLRRAGGLWTVSTPYQPEQALACGRRTVLWIGNVRISAPGTGMNVGGTSWSPRHWRALWAQSRLIQHPPPRDFPEVQWQ
jgi:hypothetical protein